MKVLMFGRGVIAASYGWAFAKAGHHVEFYVRPGRASAYGDGLDVDVLDARGWIFGRTVRERWTVPCRETLDHDHDFDLIVLSVQHASFDAAVRFLAPRVGKATVLIFNNLWVEPLAAVAPLPREQLAWGFPGAGGGFGPDGVLHAAVLPLVFFGTFGAPPTAREERVRALFRATGFSVQEQPDFRGWLWIHFIQNAGMHTQALPLRSLARVATTRGATREALLAMRELLPLVEARGIDLRLHAGSLAPLRAPALVGPLLALMWRYFPPMRRVVEAHANPEELRSVCRDTLAEARRLGLSTPRLAAAERYFEGA